MSRPVDVLAAIDNAIEADGRAHSITRAELHDARAAIAKLIDALDVAAYGEYLPESVEQEIRIALAGVRGEEE